MIAANLPAFDAFFAEFDDWFEWRRRTADASPTPAISAPAAGWRRSAADLVEETGVLLLPASIYRSELTADSPDRFRVGVGRLDPEPALAVFAEWLRARR